LTGFGAVLQQQNVILPSGDVKIGSKDYKLAANNSPKAITAINQFPVKKVAGRIVFLHVFANL
jgi:multidrug efflux pump subunit AcrB